MCPLYGLQAFEETEMLVFALLESNLYLESSSVCAFFREWRWQKLSFQACPVRVHRQGDHGSWRRQTELWLAF